MDYTMMVYYLDHGKKVDELICNRRTSSCLYAQVV